MKLIAKETIKYGANGETAQPGETFETTDGSAAQLIELGHAEAVASPKKTDKDKS